MGAISTALLILLSAGICFGVGTWRLLSAWRVQVERQWQVDSAVAQETHALRRSLVKLEQLNAVILSARAAKIAALASGAMEALPAADKALILAVQAQEVELNLRRVPKMEWWVHWQTPLPDWSAEGLRRPPPDVLGAQVLKWMDPEIQKRGWKVGAHSARRAARGWLFFNRRWELRWVDSSF